MTEEVAAPDQPAWPPPPAVPVPLSEHDAFLAALLRAPITKPPMSRLGLVRELRRATGRDLRQCLTTVDNFCERYGVFSQPQGLRAWLPILPSLLQFGLAVASIAIQVTLGRELAAVHTRAARRVILLERVHCDLVLLGLILLCTGVLLVRVLASSRWAQRQAEDARAAVAQSPPSSAPPQS